MDLLMPVSPTHYRDFLKRYVEDARKRRPGFSLGAWAKALGLQSTSSLTKVLNGQREAGPELIDRLISYFEFDSGEEEQFRKWVALSKLKENEKMKEELFESLFHKRNADVFKSRLIEFDQFELLGDPWPLAIRELTRISGMKVAKLIRILPNLSQAAIERSLNLLSRLKLVKRNEFGDFVAAHASLHTVNEISSEAIRCYHSANLRLALEAQESTATEERDFQSLVLLMSSSQVPELKAKIRAFMDSLELSVNSDVVDRLYHVQVQVFPISTPFAPSNLLPQSEEPHA